MTNIKYTVTYLEHVVQKEIPTLSKSGRELLIRAIEERLTIDPIRFGKPLRHDLSGYRSLRVSRYRIIYQVKTEEQAVIVSAIHHRKDSYE